MSWLGPSGIITSSTWRSMMIMISCVPIGMLLWSVRGLLPNLKLVSIAQIVKLDIAISPCWWWRLRCFKSMRNPIESKHSQRQAKLKNTYKIWHMPSRHTWMWMWMWIWIWMLILIWAIWAIWTAWTCMGRCQATDFW